MKNAAVFVFCTVLVLPLIVFPLRASGAGAHESGAVLKDITEKEWFLSEVRNTGKTVTIDRRKLAADNMGGIFTLSFRQENASSGSQAPNGGQASGMGAPNRFFAPFTDGSNRALNIGNLASTMMAAIREPEGLKEREYFDYLSKVTRWDLKNGKLELYSSAGAGSEAILVFVLPAS